MSAYNWIEFDGCCPSCKRNVSIRCQTHFCSDYDGDETGRFHDRTYKLGDAMAWWNSSDSRYSQWLDSNLSVTHDYDVNDECCYSECLSCGAELFVIIGFSECTPIKTLDMGVLSDWPQGYYK